MSTEAKGSALATIIATLAEAEYGSSARFETDGARYVCKIEDDDRTGFDHINDCDYSSPADRQPVEDLMNGYGPYGVIVELHDVETCQCCGHTEVSERDVASLWGIDSLENGYKAEVISELLAELGVTE